MVTNLERLELDINKLQLNENSTILITIADGDEFAVDQLAHKLRSIQSPEFAFNFIILGNGLKLDALEDSDLLNVGLKRV
jgi:hypothetical protein